MLIWFLYPVTYDYNLAMQYSFKFYESQRVGKLPDNDIPWRHDSLLQEYTFPYAGKVFDFGGGYMQGGQVRKQRISLTFIPLPKSFVVDGTQFGACRASAPSALQMAAMLLCASCAFDGSESGTGALMASLTHL